MSAPITHWQRSHRPVSHMQQSTWFKLEHMCMRHMHA